MFTVECAIRKNGSSESENFLGSMTVADKAKIMRIIKRLANKGKIFNIQQFNKLDKKIFEFKHYQTRILMYYCPNYRFALTHGFYKKGKKAPKVEIKRANQIMNEYDKIREEMEL